MINLKTEYLNDSNILTSGISIPGVFKMYERSTKIESITFNIENDHAVWNYSFMKMFLDVVYKNTNWVLKYLFG